MIVKIQHRRGSYTDYDPSKVLPGELVVTQSDDPNSSDGEAVYIGTKAGKVKQLATSVELDSKIATALQSAIPEFVDEVTQEAQDAANRAEAAAEHLVTDTTLTVEGRAADAKKTGDEIAQLKDDISQIVPGLSDEAKTALLDCFQHVAWLDHDADYYQRLSNALYSSQDVISISAVFNSGSAVLYPDTSLDDLKVFLTVTATYGDSHSAEVTSYALSGSLAIGENTITVSYRKKITTFTVTISDYEWGSDYTWLYRPSENGLLSEDENVSTVVQGGSPVETVSDGILNVKTIGDTYNIYKLIPLTSTNASIRAKLRFNKLPAATYPTGPRLQVSNGTTGAQLFALKDVNTNRYIIATNAGTNRPTVADNITLNQWYIVGCELKNGKQIISVDGNESIYDALSSYACTETRFIVQSPNTSENNETDVDIAWISFKSNDE